MNNPAAARVENVYQLDQSHGSPIHLVAILVCVRRDVRETPVSVIHSHIQISKQHVPVSFKPICPSGIQQYLSAARHNQLGEIRRGIEINRFQIQQLCSLVLKEGCCIALNALAIPCRIRVNVCNLVVFIVSCQTHYHHADVLLLCQHNLSFCAQQLSH